MDSRAEKSTSPLPSYRSETAQFQAQYLSKNKQADLTDISVCASSGGGSSTKQKQKQKHAERGLGGSLQSWIFHHQIGLSANLIALLVLTHLCLPRARSFTRKFLELQYFDTASGMFTRGPDDIYYVLFWVVAFTGIRDAVMTYVLQPFAGVAGIKKNKTKTRFVEQAWLLVYYAVFWSLGMYLYVTSEHFLDLPKLWDDFPVIHIDPLLKTYYLLQLAFWLHMIIAIHLEERRKDHWQMLMHHIVTCCLFVLSYGYYQTRVGLVILCLMDSVDLILSPAKMLKYAGYDTVCDVVFGLFILAWFLARHVAYLTVCWSVYYDVAEVMTFGCYSSSTGRMVSKKPPSGSRFSLSTVNGTVPDGGTEILTNIFQPYIAPGELVCYNKKMKYVFLVFLLALQGITILWFRLILRVAWRVLKGQGADDVRSDDEGDDEAEEVNDIVDIEPARPLQPIEQVVGVEEMNIKRKSSPASSRFSAVKSEQGSSTGIPVKKEILNRIGCETKTE